MTRNGVITVVVLIALIGAAYFLLPGNRPKTIAYKEFSTQQIEAACNTQAVSSVPDAGADLLIKKTPGQIDPGGPVRIFDKKGLAQFLKKDIHAIAAAAGIPKARHTDYKPLSKPVTLKLGTTSEKVIVHPFQISFQADANAAARLLHTLTEGNIHVISAHTDSGDYSRNSNVSILMYLYEEKGD